MQKYTDIARAVIYARYSSDKQTEQSIEGQLADCQAFAERMGLQIVDTYVDRAMTATSDRRPQFQKMIKDSEKGGFDVILVWKLDRFARNRYDSAVYKRKLKGNGVRVMSVMENITDTPEGVLMESVLEGFAEYFSKDLAQKVKRGMRETARKHKITNRLPFGYCKSDQGTYIPDPHTEGAVRKVFDMYVSGIRKSDIADYLNDNGFKTAYGNKFKVSSITPIIKNTRYIGIYHYDTEEYYDEAQRIVTDDIFNKAQKKVSENRHGGSCKAVERYLLSNKLYCGYCHSRMNGESGKSCTGTPYHYYACMGRKRKHICTCKNVKKDIVELHAMNAITSLLNDEYAIETILDLADDYQTNDAERLNEIKVVEQRLNDVNSKILNILSAIEMGIITPATKERLQELESVKAQLDYDLICKKADGVKYSRATLKRILENLNLTDAATMPEKRALVDQLIYRIYLWDDKILIIFNFSSLVGDDKKTLDADIDAVLTSISEQNKICSDINEYGTPDQSRTGD